MTGSEDSKARGEPLGPQKVADELVAALDFVRWDADWTSRNGLYHMAVGNSRARLRRAIRSACLALRAQGDKEEHEENPPRPESPNPGSLHLWEKCRSVNGTPNPVWSRCGRCRVERLTDQTTEGECPGEPPEEGSP